MTRRGRVSAAKQLLQARNTEGLRCDSTGSSKAFPQGKGGLVNPRVLPGATPVTTATKHAATPPLACTLPQGQALPALERLTLCLPVPLPSPAVGFQHPSCFPTSTRSPQGPQQSLATSTFPSLLCSRRTLLAKAFGSKEISSPCKSSAWQSPGIASVRCTEACNPCAMHMHPEAE